MAWVYLIVAGLFEIGFAGLLKSTEGFTRLWPTIGFLACATISFILINRAIITIPIGTAYAVWTGIGAAGAAIVGIVYYHEPASVIRLFFITTLVASIIGLQLASQA